MRRVILTSTHTEIIARDQVCRTGPKIGKQEINEQELENKFNYRKQIAR